MNIPWRIILYMGLTTLSTPSLSASGGLSVSALLAGGEVTMATLIANAPTIDAVKPAQLYATSVAEIISTPAISVSAFVSGTSDQVVDTDVAVVTISEESVTVSHAEKREKTRASVKKPVSAPPVVTVSIASEEPLEPQVTSAEKILTLFLDSAGNLSHEPKVLDWARVGDVISVNIDRVPDSTPVTLFVRDSATVEWNANSRELKAAGQGQTEIYAVSGKTMRIIPATVKSSGPRLDIPQALTSLDGVFDKASSQALFAGVSRAMSPDGAVDVETKQALAASVEETVQALAAQETVVSNFGLEQAELLYGSIALQFTDDRSLPEGGLIYPLDGLEVWIVGTEFLDETDATGHVVIADVPANSRLLIGYRDRLDRVRPGFVIANTNERGVTRIRAYREFAFSTAAEIAGVVQTAGTASVCFSVKQEGVPVQGLGVGIDIPADGPYYFNDLGYLDRGHALTGADGRSCFYNVEPGPYAITLYEDEQPFLTHPLSAFAGFHSEETIDIAHESHINLYLASVANAHEQLSSDPAVASSMTAIDAIDVVPLGTGTPLMQRDFGWLTSTNPLFFHDSRLGVLTQAAEFESVLYSIDPDPEAQVLPLLPRGFVEDLSLYAQESFDPTLGVALIEHGVLEGQGSDQVQIRLLDVQGREVRGGWYFADAPVTKAMFFNLPAATYIVIAETGEGYWMAADVLRVYNETVSYVRLGSRTQLLE